MKMRNTLALALVVSTAPLFPSAAMAQLSISVNIVPPVLPVYVQPPLPAPGYLWTPGYWAWSAATNDYYWIPGTWVMPPTAGLLWTPGYWGFADGAYLFHRGYWGDHIGFYGGINYGFGYVGHGYEGGRWNGGVFDYNAAVNNVNTTVVHNVYRTTVNNVNITNTRVSYNGGNGGVPVRPTAEEARFETGRHLEATADQTRHEREAMVNPSQRASVNHGVPMVAATPRPAQFAGAGVVHGGPGGAPRDAAAMRHEQPPREAPQGHEAPQAHEARQGEPARETRREPQQPPREAHAMAQHAERPPAVEHAPAREHGGEGEPHGEPRHEGR